MAMLDVGNKVSIRYRDASGEVFETGWTVVEYDDGLVKLHRDAITYRSGNDPLGTTRVIKAATKVVHMRSSSFLSAELE